MRAPASRFLLLLVLSLFVGVGTSSRAYADARGDAKVHYQAGVKAYAAADYRGAIKEFSAAQQLMPADLNNYNLALCYDKLGEGESAIQYYKEYLAKVPNADKRAEIEASIQRLEAALQSAATKRTDEQRKADEAAKADAARQADATRKAEEAKKAEVAKKQTAGSGGGSDAAGVGGAVGTGGAVTAEVGVGSTGTPGTGQAVSTGDAQLDRVSSIDVNQVRDQRTGGAGSGMPDTHGGPATNPSHPGAAGAGAGAGMQANAGAGGAQGTLPADQQQPAKKETPVYKKWWFWAVVAVSAYVVYSIAVDGSKSPNAVRETLPQSATNAPGGMTLLRF